MCVNLKKFTLRVYQLFKFMSNCGKEQDDKTNLYRNGRSSKHILDIKKPDENLAATTI